MTEKTFDSRFHKFYVGGDGSAEDRLVELKRLKYSMQTIEEIRGVYRKYVGDPKAELPAEVLEQLKLQGKI